MSKRKPTVPTTVLVVEDDENVRSVIVKGLRREGYYVLEDSASDPVDFSNLPRVDVLVCDVGLPSESGADLARRCRDTWPHCDVLLMSGHAPEDLKRRGVSSNALVVQKPVQPKQIADHVYQLLTQRAWRSFRTDN